MDSASGEITQIVTSLDSRLRCGEIAPQEHMSDVDTLIIDRWPELGWVAL